MTTTFDGKDRFAYLKQQAACFEWIRRQVPVVEFGPPEFCVFDDMHAFETRLYLGSESMTPPPQAAHIAGETQ